MQLLKNWKRILRKAWSVRLMILAGLLSGAEVVLPLLSDNMPRGVFAGLSMIVVSSAFIARIVVQRGMDDDEDDNG